MVQSAPPTTCAKAERTSLASANKLVSGATGRVYSRDLCLPVARAGLNHPHPIYILQINTIVLRQPRPRAMLPPPGIAGSHRLFDNLNHNQNRHRGAWLRGMDQILSLFLLIPLCLSLCPPCPPWLPPNSNWKTGLYHEIDPVRFVANRVQTP